jgi:protein CpxP
MPRSSVPPDKTQDSFLPKQHDISSESFIMSQFIDRTGRGIAVASLLGALLTATVSQASHAQTAVPAPATTAARSTAVHVKHTDVDRVEARITELHDKLHVTTDQATLWASVAQAMRDSAKTIHVGLADRSAHAKTMTAVDDLKSYQILANDHADGLKQLIPAFEALYAAMTPAQQKNADRIFSEHQQHKHV